MKATSIDVTRIGCPWGGGMAIPSGLRIQVTGHIRLDDGLLAEDLLVEGRAWVEFVERLRHGEGIREVFLLETGPRHARLRLVGVQCPLSVAIARARQAPVLPWRIIDQGERVVILGTDPRPLLDAARDAGLVPRVARIQEFEPRNLLTARQEEILEAALAAGYWDLPRGTTLSALADSLGITPASLTQTLALIERRVLSARAGADTHGDGGLDKADADAAPTEKPGAGPARDARRTAGRRAGAGGVD